LAKGWIGGRIPVVAMKAGAVRVVVAVVSEKGDAWLFASAFSSSCVIDISGITSNKALKLLQTGKQSS
jgi:hypothetical protein